MPLTQTAVKSWVDLIFQIQENKAKFQTDSIYFYDLQRFINHSFTISSLPINEVQKLGEVERNTIRYNKIFQNISSLQQSKELSKLCSLVFKNWNENWSKALSNIRALNTFFINRMDEEFEFEKTILYVFDEALVELQNIIEEGIPEMSQRASSFSLTNIGLVSQLASRETKRKDFR